MDTKQVMDMRFNGSGLDNDGKIWSEADKRLLVEYFNECVGITEIALRLGRSEPAITQQLKKEGLFESETQRRFPRFPKSDCLCPRCKNYFSCPQAQENNENSVYPMKGEGAYHV